MIFFIVILLFYVSKFVPCEWFSPRAFQPEIKELPSEYLEDG